MLPPLTFTGFCPRSLRHPREQGRWGNHVLHFIGATRFLGLSMSAFVLRRWELRGAGAVAADGLAWVGHVVIGPHRPAPFQYPWFSLLGDFRLYRNPWRGRERF